MIFATGRLKPTGGLRANALMKPMRTVRANP